MCTKEFKRKFLWVIVLFIFLVQIITPMKVMAEKNKDQSSKVNVIRARIEEIISPDEKNNKSDSEKSIEKEQMIKVKILKGKHEGEEIKVKNSMGNSRQDNLKIKKGDQVFLSISEDNTGKINSADIYQIAKDKQLLYLLMFFIILMILVGGRKGIKSVITLMLTAVIILKVFLNLILKGYNPIIVAIFVCTGIIIMTIVIVSGINKKSMVAIIGTSSGVIISGIISFIVVNSTKVSGLGTEDAQMLMYSPLARPLDFKAILLAAILIGALGAVMDVSMSIASTMTEIKKINPNISTGKFMKAGMSVGRDIMGTMANTLVLAYISGSICLILGYMANNNNFIEIVNQDMIACEIVKTLAGSIGLIFTIPITVIICCIFMRE